jgi:hypothetical protein
MTPPRRTVVVAATLRAKLTSRDWRAVLALVAIFYRWDGKRYREPDERRQPSARSVDGISEKLVTLTE